MSEKLKRELIELLEKDVELRYTVAGYLGLSEVLKRMEKLVEKMVILKESMVKLEEGHSKLWESQKRLWEGVKSLREGQEKLWEVVKSLREGQEKLWESNNKLWFEFGRLRNYVKASLSELRRTLGVAFEEHVASFLEVMLGEMGYEEARVERRYFVDDGEVVEINLFSEEPLVVGEAKTRIEDVDMAVAEVEKLVRRVRLVERIYGERPLITVLAVARTDKVSAEKLRELCNNYGIRLVLGREMEEYLGV